VGEISMRLKKQYYGMNRLIRRIEKEVLLEQFYSLWIIKSDRSKASIKRRLRKLIREELLGPKLYRAIALDVLPAQAVVLDSHLYRFLKREVYKGDVRALLGDLQDVKSSSEEG
jgi:hypothetical protein